MNVSFEMKNTIFTQRDVQISCIWKVEKVAGVSSSDWTQFFLWRWHGDQEAETKHPDTNVTPGSESQKSLVGTSQKQIRNQNPVIANYIMYDFFSCLLSFNESFKQLFCVTSVARCCFAIPVLQKLHAASGLGRKCRVLTKLL